MVINYLAICKTESGRDAIPEEIKHETWPTAMTMKPTSQNTCLRGRLGTWLSDDGAALTDGCSKRDSNRHRGSPISRDRWRRRETRITIKGPANAAFRIKSPILLLPPLDRHSKKASPAQANQPHTKTYQEETQVEQAHTYLTPRTVRNRSNLSALINCTDEKVAERNNCRFQAYIHIINQNIKQQWVDVSASPTLAVVTPMSEASRPKAGDKVVRDRGDKAVGIL